MKIFALLLISVLTLFAEFKEAEGSDYTYDTAQRYCRQLDGGVWRVPTIKELFELRGETARFGKERAFWSSSSVSDGKSQTSTGSEGEGAQQEGTKIGYTFYLQDGDVTLSPLTKKAGVICTDTIAPNEKKEYAKSEAGIVDSENSIIWMPLDASDKKEKYSYEAAQTFCEENSYRGRSWRLPTVEELYGIVDYAYVRPTVNTALFGVMMNRYYWSGDEFGADKGFVVGFKLGSVATSAKENRSYVRCVSDIEP